MSLHETKRIGQLSAELGLNPKTIRYYEEIELLPPPERSASGYRIYSECHINMLRFISRAKGLGFSLDEIRAILRVAGDRKPPCQRVGELISAKLSMIDQEIRALRELEERLRRLEGVAREPEVRRATFCRIIEDPRVVPGEELAGCLSRLAFSRGT